MFLRQQLPANRSCCCWLIQLSNPLPSHLLFFSLLAPSLPPPPLLAAVCAPCCRLLGCRYTNGGKDKARYKEAQLCAKSVWVELKGAWHELKFHVQHKAGVDYVFVEHIAFERPGTPYGDSSGPFKDNLFRFALLCLGGLEAPLNLPIVRDT